MGILAAVWKEHKKQKRAKEVNKLLADPFVAELIHTAVYETIKAVATQTRTPTNLPDDDLRGTF
jgi:hypothetical protein